MGLLSYLRHHAPTNYLLRPMLSGVNAVLEVKKRVPPPQRSNSLEVSRIQSAPENTNYLNYCVRQIGALLVTQVVRTYSSSPLDVLVVVFTMVVVLLSPISLLDDYSSSKHMTGGGCMKNTTTNCAVILSSAGGIISKYNLYRV